MANLIQNAAAGHRKAMETLYSGTKQRVYFICLSLLKNPADAEEALTRVYRGIWQEMKPNNVATEADFEALAIRKAVQLCKKQVLRKNPKAYNMPAGRSFLITGMPPLSRKNGDEAEVILNQFTPLQRLIFVLHTAGGYDEKALAKATDLDPDTTAQALAAQTANIETILQAMGKAHTVTLQNVLDSYMAGMDETQVPEKANASILAVIGQISAPVEQQTRKKAALGLAALVLLVGIVVTVILLLPKSPADGGAPAFTFDPSADENVVQPDEVITHYAEIEIQNYGTITVALYGEAAPITVQNFVELAESGFYEGTTFHRIIEGFMMQGGAPTGSEEPESIYGEFSSNGFENNIAHTRGVISMARADDPDSASSQFFIMHDKAEHLDGDYAAFGCVTEGMSIVDAICTAAEPIDGNGSIAAADRPVIVSITITPVQTETDTTAPDTTEPDTTEAE